MTEEDVVVKAETECFVLPFDPDTVDINTALQEYKKLFIAFIRINQKICSKYPEHNLVEDAEQNLEQFKDSGDREVIIIEKIEDGAP